jgi:tetratricopeptide (TPR) repeat protein
MGDVATARVLSERAIAIRKLVFESTHPLLASSYAGLAAIERKAGRLTVARELLLNALEIDERAYGKDHPSVARDCSTLAFVEADDGNIERAQSLMRRAWEIRQLKYGAHHARTESCRRWLATHDPEIQSDLSTEES